MHINVFLPCRKGSERVPKKNIKPFSGFNNGLVEVKLKQLLQAKSIDQIVLSSNDDEVLDYAYSLKESRICLHHRVDGLSLSSTSTDELVAHALELIGEGDILWTHVTSPFLSAALYEEIIAKYKRVLEKGYDSLMTVNSIHGFLWNHQEPLNYDRGVEKWPRTQTLDPIFEVNSAVFLANAEIYKKFSDRIGRQPYLYELDKIQSMDIDWEEDFKIAQGMVDAGVVHI